MPFIVPVIGVVAGAAGAAAGAAVALAPYALMAAGPVMQGMAAKQEGKSAEALGKYKATLARGEAATTRGQAAEEQRLKRIEMRRTLAANREITASSGMMMTGSPAEHQLQVINDYAYDIAKTGYEGEAMAMRSESMAELYTMEAKSAARAGRMGEWSAWISGASSMFGALGSTVKPKPGSTIGGGATAKANATAAAKAGG